MASIWMIKLRPIWRISCLSPAVRSTTPLSKCSPAVGIIGTRNASESFQSKNKRLGRPTSPHLLIYKFELPGLLSGSHRATGLVQSGVISLAAIGLMCAPENLEYYVNYLHSLELPRAVWASTKMLFAWPFMYHLCNGIRHLIWDVTAKGFTQSDLYRTGYLTVILSFLITGGLIWFY
ncbi:succinate dehydrogenase cytochrome b560 subunit, mitochondrial-like [Dendronephthya gigantea]|uniref:succinate dehydrogenase cytochrome b560 subunit, mitochondrial-like n=1 Tax=Dendronephthya gigantea TaxID=151771 RepID=UPI00106B35FB|nr:succinate dehydrogenase cytochrome b560 subunit, mitochondrial-like [Dendronephthya gigantea]